MNMVVGVGFEPTKAMPADLQSVPFSHLDTPPIPLMIRNRLIKVKHYLAISADFHQKAWLEYGLLSQ